MDCKQSEGRRTGTKASASLSALCDGEVFGRSEVYQLGSHGSGLGYWYTIPRHLRGRVLFGPEISGAQIQERFDQGAEVVVTPVSSEADGIGLAAKRSGDSIPLFLIDEIGDLRVVSASDQLLMRPGCSLVSFARAGGPAM